MLAPEGFVETGRPYVRDNRIFCSHRFSCDGAKYQVELPVIVINPVLGVVTRTAPHFDSDRETA